jgi:ATP-binding cassette subfamily C protein
VSAYRLCVTEGSPRTVGLTSFVRELIRFGGGRLGVGVALAVAASVTEGIGLLLLVPMLSLAGVATAPSGPLEALADRLLDPVGVQPTLGAVLVLFVAVVTVRMLLVRARDVTLMSLQLGFVDDARGRLHRSVVGADWPMVASLPRAEVLAALTNDVVRIGSGARAAMDIVRAGTLAAAYLVVSAIVSPAATGVAAVVAVLLGLVSAPVVRHARRLGARLTDSSRRLYSTASDLLDGVKVAKAHAAEQAHADAFATAVRTQRGWLLDFERARGWSNVLQQVGAAAATAALVWIAVTRLELAPARLLTVVLVLSRLLPLLTGLLQSSQQLANALPAWSEVSALTARCEAAAEPESIEAPPMTLRERIALRGVCARPGRVGPTVLHDIEIDVAARSTTAIVGASGSGKTTLADVVVGLVPVSAGTVTIDGAPLTPATSRAWRQQIAYVPQDPFLFPMTIADNLRWARPGATDDELWVALASAAAADFVRALPDGIDTHVGERGMALSGGERQRIAIARALVRRPELLVLDEATSALDVGIEAVVRDALVRLHGDVTIVVIAHRLSTIEHADAVVVLDRGRVVESGTWDEIAWRPVVAGRP